jgi:hypothetical protein
VESKKAVVVEQGGGGAATAAAAAKGLKAEKAETLIGEGYGAAAAPN